VTQPAQVSGDGWAAGKPMGDLEGHPYLEKSG